MQNKVAHILTHKSQIAASVKIKYYYLSLYILSIN